MFVDFVDLQHIYKLLILFENCCVDQNKEIVEERGVFYNSKFQCI